MMTRYEAFAGAISSIHRCIQKIERDEMIRYGYKGAFAQYLTAMTHHPDGVTAAQLCEICDRDKAAVSRAIAEMEEKQLICRSNGHGYRALLLLTEQGKSAADFVFSRAQTATQAVGKVLSDEQRRSFYAALTSIATNLDRISAVGLPKEDDMEETTHE